MTLPRRSQVALAETPYYHCVARCVRRAFLCGKDPYTEKNFEHRRQWLVDRLALQADVFAIDICAYAIMSNHYHVVLRVDQSAVLAFSDAEVIARWTRLFKGPILVQRMLAGDKLSQAQRKTILEIVAVWRKRLADISWYMRCLNEFIARRANAEDDCTGRFWEGRFKSQALLDTTALLSCMAYVDLNPVRAGIADSLEGSHYTSIKERMRKESQGCGGTPIHVLPLLEFSQAAVDQAGKHLPFQLADYVQLVGMTGRCQARRQRGILSIGQPIITKKLGLSNEQWEALIQNAHRGNLKAIGSLQKLRAFNDETGRRRSRGVGLLKLVYGM
ncbi:transposase [Seongchinamella sediminis]|uniref:Transposase n=1 Tax=Seongchinamella sediminis TaxID=2283635 RepID=A0A3L7DRM4_9GAMM|nr:transposase [Seongchinamella sediminis]RLQ20148.1 transposase [Seongchinamella sediminis]